MFIEFKEIMPTLDTYQDSMNLIDENMGSSAIIAITDYEVIADDESIGKVSVIQNIGTGIDYFALNLKDKYRTKEVLLQVFKESQSKFELEQFKVSTDMSVVLFSSDYDTVKSVEVMEKEQTDIVYKNF